MENARRVLGVTRSEFATALAASHPQIVKNLTASRLPVFLFNLSLPLSLRWRPAARPGKPSRSKEP
jgi:hypothetical protein